jgi:hypothetical protein
VAVAYEPMIADRVSRLGVDERAPARAELLRCAGEQFDARRRRLPDCAGPADPAPDSVSGASAA